MTSQLLLHHAGADGFHHAVDGEILRVSPCGSFDVDDVMARPGNLCSRMGSALSYQSSSYAKPTRSDSERDSGFCAATHHEEMSPSPLPGRSR